ncbi:MAG: hypothetical protein CMM58_01710 [Rhodospirillaceae bacterium]|nr:hypothetical protein [Rhodospirillaceae bacterium]|tara:strand:- start:3129 stop:3443 length:315 start_codon:yes stop_codon:yes gene_type:complete
MATLTVVYWRDIPAQVIARKGRGRRRESVKLELDKRFSQAIDAAAMKQSLTSDDDYLALWRRAQPMSCGEDLAAEAERISGELHEIYSKERLLELVENGGKDGV